jgi:hypothetical protein
MQLNFVQIFNTGLCIKFNLKNYIKIS